MIGYAVLPLTREWIEITVISVMRLGVLCVLPLTREWIEIVFSLESFYHGKVLPLTREWIEIIGEIDFIDEVQCSPSYEGVD